MCLRGWTPHYGDTSDLHCTRFLSLRRIASAVCAFGATFIGSRMNSYPFSKKAATYSIFREKSGDFNPDSSVGPKVSRQRAKYDDGLPGR
jgi:hypothetical protein